MKKKNIKDEVVEKNEEVSFWERCKTDKKYKAKIELIGYGVLVLFLVIYLNIGSMNSGIGNVSSIMNDNMLDKNTNEKDSFLNGEVDLIKKLDDNYQYDVLVNLKHVIDNTEIESELSYSGKRYDEEVIIDRVINEEKNTYYKIGTLYYSFVDDKYSVIDEEIVYNMLDKRYIELEGLLELLDVASLDHVTDYSSGKKEYVYHLKVRDIDKTYVGDENIEFSLVSDNDILSIKVDYSDLFKVIKKDILECEVEYTYQNIGKIEEFHVMSDNNAVE